MKFVVKFKATDLGTTLWKKLFAEIGQASEYSNYDEVHLTVEVAELFYSS